VQQEEWSPDSKEPGFNKQNRAFLLVERRYLVGFFGLAEGQKDTITITQRNVQSA
jgi:hypothetical protein